MAAKSHRLGPGVLTFGETASPVEFGASTREVLLESETDQDDALPVLSGDEIEGEETTTYTLSGSVLQSYDKESLLVWSHVNAGKIVPFVFVPDSDKALGVKGYVKVRRLSIGGEVKTRNTSDFEFPGRNGIYTLHDMDAEGSPELTAYSQSPGTPPPGLDPDSPEWD